MGLNLAHGGHLSHGSPVNSSGLFYKPVAYSVNEATGLIDYDAMEEIALKERPKNDHRWGICLFKGMGL